MGEENKQHCIAAGMNAVLSKLLTKIKAADIIKAFISQRCHSSVLFSKDVRFRLDLPSNDETLFDMVNFSLMTNALSYTLYFAYGKTSSPTATTDYQPLSFLVSLAGSACNFSIINKL